MSTSTGLAPPVVAMREARAADAQTARATAASATSASGPAVAASAAASPARAAEPTAAAPVRSAFVPLLLGLTAMVTVLGHQAWQLEQVRRQLLVAREAAAPRLEAANQLRRSLDLLAADTQRLADGGHASARLLVEELRRRGITINVAASTAGTAAAAAPAASR